MIKFDLIKNHNISEEVSFYFKGIFDRQYYTESGPLVRNLEGFLQEILNAKNVICVSNASICWLMLLELKFNEGLFLLPQEISNPLKEAINWLGFSTKVYKDLDFLSCKGIDNKLNYDAAVVSCGIQINSLVEELQRINSFDRQKIIIDTECINFEFIDSLNSRDWNMSGVLNFDTADLGYGACICTNNDLLADQLRCMRSSGGVRNKVLVNRTVNGRMSEAQAAFVLIQAEKFFKINFTDI